jgi:hypothetical protein
MNARLAIAVLALALPSSARAAAFRTWSLGGRAHARAAAAANTAAGLENRLGALEHWHGATLFAPQTWAGLSEREIVERAHRTLGPRLAGIEHDQLPKARGGQHEPSLDALDQRISRLEGVRRTEVRGQRLTLVPRGSTLSGRFAEATLEAQRLWARAGGDTRYNWPRPANRRFTWAKPRFAQGPQQPRFFPHDHAEASHFLDSATQWHGALEQRLQANGFRLDVAQALDEAHAISRSALEEGTEVRYELKSGLVRDGFAVITENDLSPVINPGKSVSRHYGSRGAGSWLEVSYDRESNAYGVAGSRFDADGNRWTTSVRVTRDHLGDHVRVERNRFYFDPAGRPMVEQIIDDEFIDGQEHVFERAHNIGPYGQQRQGSRNRISAPDSGAIALTPVDWLRPMGPGAATR